MTKKADFSKYDKVETTLQAGTMLDGVLRFRKPLKISGGFDGEIESESLLIVDSGAEVRADIAARVVIINGSVTGNVTASERIEILGGGRVKGNLKAARIKIADNVEFEGRCRMIRDPETIDIFSAPVEKLKEIARNG